MKKSELYRRIRNTISAETLNTFKENGETIVIVDCDAPMIEIGAKVYADGRVRIKAWLTYTSMVNTRHVRYKITEIRPFEQSIIAVYENDPDQFARVITNALIDNTAGIMDVIKNALNPEALTLATCMD